MDSDGRSRGNAFRNRSLSRHPVAIAGARTPQVVASVEAANRPTQRKELPLFFVIWIALGVVTAIAAQARGRSFIGWLVIGLLTGIFGLIAVLVMENLKDQPRS